MNSVTRIARPPDKPLLIFDGDCAFCRRWITRWKQTTGERVDYVPLQSATIAAQFPELSLEQLESAVHLVEPNGRVTRGAEAVFRALAVARRPQERGRLVRENRPDENHADEASALHWPLWLYENVPGFAPVSELAYRVIAANRRFFSLITRWLWGQRVEQPTNFLVRWLFLRLLGVTYLIAFLSLNAQLPGLIGSNGIVPAQQVMRAITQDTADLGLDRFRVAPTLCWCSAEDGFLRGLSIAGMALSALLILNFAPALCLFLLWLIYLSLTQVSTIFLGYQWDNLLLETGLLAIFFAPSHLWPKLAREAPPPRVVLWLLRWLLFRLMFASGLAKLLSGDATWHDLTALTFHYETQPLPTPLAWYAHNLPVWFHKASCAGMFSVELILPFLIFVPRRPRVLAFWAFMLLMLGIALTGNYTFFNLLACALCVTLLDDFALVPFAPQTWAERVGAGARPAWLRPRPRLLRWARGAGLALLLALVLGVSAVEMLAKMGVRWPADHPLVKLYQWVAPFRSINGYGLFAVMTTSRPEIIVEGSHDGKTWQAYEFRHKPGDLRRRPSFVAPHQPRLDWQMWFAALGEVRGNPWFVNFCFRLLQGKPEVLALMEKNPFPDRPPKLIRARVYEYHFTTPEERRKDGAWWRREYKGEYCPPLSLQGFARP
ncbi:MAG TPA: lipase maturation factor family protein [Verrucomicrobiae bacterium]|jgi:predicted DCC family thiol-disulfide oxidoreductase YuxK